MGVFRHTSALPQEARGCVVAIGNFDGVHRGHQAILARTCARASALNTGAAVLSFEPHPRQVFRPDDPPFRLSSFRTKIRVLESLGLDHLYIVHFDLAFARKSAHTFVEEILARDLQARHVVVGGDFRFGNKRLGDVKLLRELGARHGFDVSSLCGIRDEHGVVISSSAVRAALREGRPREANRLLGRPWEVEGRVEHGAKRGRTIGFPTANVALGDYLEPVHGIYAVRAGVDQGADTHWWDAVAYIGTRPTVAGESVFLEVHVFGLDADLYGQHLRVQFLEFLRGDHAFEDLAAMEAQIARDCDAARDVLAREPLPLSSGAPGTAVEAPGSRSSSSRAPE